MRRARQTRRARERGQRELRRAPGVPAGANLRAAHHRQPRRARGAYRLLRVVRPLRGSHRRHGGGLRPRARAHGHLHRAGPGRPLRKHMTAATIDTPALAGAAAVVAARAAAQPAAAVTLAAAAPSPSPPPVEPSPSPPPDPWPMPPPIPPPPSPSPQPPRSPPPPSPP